MAEFIPRFDHSDVGFSILRNTSFRLAIIRTHLGKEITKALPYSASMHVHTYRNTGETCLYSCVLYEMNACVCMQRCGGLESVSVQPFAYNRHWHIHLCAPSLLSLV